MTLWILEDTDCIINMKLKYKGKGEPYDPEFEDFWYNLTDGGHCDPKEYCVNKSDIIKILEAIEVLKDYEESLYNLAYNYYEEGFNEEE